MFNVIRLIDVSSESAVRIRDSLVESVEGRAARYVVAPTLAGSRNGGDLLMHVRFDGEDDWRSVAADVDAALTDPAITRVNGADYEGTATVIADRDPGSVYRTLLLRVESGTDDGTLARFEADLRRLPRYVSSISASQLSRPTRTLGTSAWTHVFEQEFTDADGIMGPYLMHPIHWAVVDQWFDPECPKVIVRDRVCHSFCDDPSGVLR